MSFVVLVVLAVVGVESSLSNYKSLRTKCVPNQTKKLQKERKGTKNVRNESHEIKMTL